MEALIVRTTELLNAMTAMLLSVQQMSDQRFMLITLILVVFIMAWSNRHT